MKTIDKIRREWSRIFRRTGRASTVQLRAVDRPSVKYGDFMRSNTITFPKRAIFRRDDVFFAMGSCFAEEIRIALTARGLRCVPSYREIEFDPTLAVVDELPEREHMNFYNTFTVRQQIEQLLGLWTQPDDDWWLINKRQETPPWGPTCYQDPYRRLILAKSPEVLRDVLAGVNREMRAGFNAATAFIFTFGMTEVFVNKATGKVAAQKPLYKGAGGAAETELHVSTFAENHENVSRVVDMIRQHKPDAPIVLTVSPVPLARTFQDADIVTVNAESKAILRAVLGQICREKKGVYYLPSFELVTLGGIAQSYEGDGRHVKRSVVDRIVEEFFRGHFQAD